MEGDTMEVHCYASAWEGVCLNLSRSYSEKGLKRGTEKNKKRYTGCAMMGITHSP